MWCDVRDVALSSHLSCRRFAQKDWPTYGHDAGGMRYSPLKQINTTNVQKLRRAWTYHTGDTSESVRDHADRRQQSDVLLDADQPHRRAGAGDRQERSGPTTPKCAGRGSIEAWRTGRAIARRPLGLSSPPATEG